MLWSECGSHGAATADATAPDAAAARTNVRGARPRRVAPRPPAGGLSHFASRGVRLSPVAHGGTEGELSSDLPFQPSHMRLTKALMGAALGGALFVTLPAQGQVADTSRRAAADTGRSTADSTYSEEQAGRGEQVFTRTCLECHARSEMASADFRLKWGGQSTYDLFKSIATTMPDSDPGSLPRAEYEDVVAYILKLNGIPAGPAQLVSDSASMSRAKLMLPPRAEATHSFGAPPSEGRRLTMRRSVPIAHGRRTVFPR